MRINLSRFPVSFAADLLHLPIGSGLNFIQATFFLSSNAAASPSPSERKRCAICRRSLIIKGDINGNAIRAIRADNDKSKAIPEDSTATLVAIDSNEAVGA